jgi:hypothetical protein
VWEGKEGYARLVQLWVGKEQEPFVGGKGRISVVRIQERVRWQETQRRKKLVEHRRWPLEMLVSRSRGECPKQLRTKAESRQNGFMSRRYQPTLLDVFAAFKPSTPFSSFTSTIRACDSASASASTSSRNPRREEREAKMVIG